MLPSLSKKKIQVIRKVTKFVGTSGGDSERVFCSSITTLEKTGTSVTFSYSVSSLSSTLYLLTSFFLRFLLPVVPSVSLLTQHVYSFVYFCVIFLIDLFTRFVGFSLGTYDPYKNLSMCLVSYHKYSDLYS
jgi:hypothetical protein